MISSRGRLLPLIIPPERTAVWTAADEGRARTYEAKLTLKGVSEAERRRWIPCIVWSAKVPGLRYPEAVEKRIAELR
jgi:hypothetical protein